ncbi:MAG: AraC family transcriptional regulator [Treponema sp.]|nr:AraC family transcriptional regulator [Treponema sp.]
MKYYFFTNADKTKSSVCGCAMLNPGWCHMQRKLDCESVLIIGRKNTCLIDNCGERLEVKPGRMILLPAGLLHKGIEAIKEPCSYYWFHFFQRSEYSDELRYFLPKEIDEKEAEKLLSNPRDFYNKYENDILLPQSFDLISVEKINNLCAEILHEYAKPSFSRLVYNQMIEELLLTIDMDCFKYFSEKTDDKADSVLVKKLLLLFEDELSNQNASVKFFADLLNVNQDYLGRCFKNVMDISIGKYITKRRISLACSRLRETHDSIEEIARQCGFGSRRQFYDDFKQLTGTTPLRYREDSAYIGINTL